MGFIKHNKKTAKWARALLCCAVLPMYVSSIGAIGITSCSDNKSVRNINGKDWVGRLAGDFAPDDYEIDTANKTVTYIFGRAIRSYNLVIPNYVKFNGEFYKVLLGKNCFADNTSLQATVELNDFIYHVPDGCFQGCTSLTGIIFHDYPTVINTCAFADCFLLSKIIVVKDRKVHHDWSSHLIQIDDFAFFNAILDGELIFSQSLVSIGRSAFEKCTGITNIDMSTCIKIISTAPSQFASCSMLKQISLPPSLQTISNRTFRDCTGLFNVILPRDNMHLRIGDNAFYNCKYFKAFSRSVIFDEIGPGAFSMNLHNGMHLWEPQYNVSSISPHAFSSCGFASLKFYKDGPDIMDYAFANNRELCVLDFCDFVDEEGSLIVPSWSGEHIFAGANPNGGTILFPVKGLLDDAWLEFFNKNDINLNSSPSGTTGGAWRIVHKGAEITHIFEPEKTFIYKIVYDTEGQVLISFDGFSYEATPDFDMEKHRQHLRVSYSPPVSEKAEIINEDIIWHRETNTLQVDIRILFNNIESGKSIDMSAPMIFYYDNYIIPADHSDFRIIIANND